MGNDYGISPFTMLEILSPLIILAPTVMTLLVFGPMLLYPIARWKLNRAGIDDPQLGLKFVLSYFALHALHVALIAITIVLYALVAKGKSTDLYRSGFGFLLPSAIVFAVHFVVLQRTNQDQYPTVRRLFLGYNLAVTGFAGFVMLVFACQVWFAKGNAGNAGRLAIVGVLVYVGAWALCGRHFLRAVLGNDSTSSGPPPNVVLPVAPSGSTGLPPLGGGSYPPLEQR